MHPVHRTEASASRSCSASCVLLRRFTSVAKPGSLSVIQFRRRTFMSFLVSRRNPSVNRTLNSGARLLASAASVAPLRSACFQRWAYFMNNGIEKVRFPVLAFSPAGWNKVAATALELTEASPDDLLDDWQRLEVYDSAGFVHRATRAFRFWPKSNFRKLLCCLVRQQIYVGFQFEKPELVQLQELVRRAKAIGEISEEDGWLSHEHLLRALSE
jgi:hypothetical protein